MEKKLNKGDTAMVRIVNPINTCIEHDKVIPVIYTCMGLMVHTDVMGVHVDPKECQIVDMPLQCLI